MPASSRLLQQCFEEALSSAPEMLARCADAAIASLQAAEKASMDVRERDQFAKAWWGLLQNKIPWGSQFTQHLREALDTSPESNSSRPGLLSTTSMLSLVEDQAVNESLESARLVHDLLPVVEQQLSVLDALMSSVVGLPTVQAERNPMRPSVFVRALRALMAASESEPEVRAMWLRHMDKALGHELQKLYERVALILQRANVQEAGYRVRLASGATRPGVGGSASTRAAPFDTSSHGELASQWQTSGHGTHRNSTWGSATHLPPMPSLGRRQPGVGHHVFHEFLNEGGAQYDRHLTPEYYEQVSEELAAIEAYAAIPLLDESMIIERQTQYRDLPAVDRPAREVGIGSQLSRQAWGTYAAAHERERVLMHLKQKAQRVHQAVGLDLVRTLVSQVASDPLLLGPVREAVVALEPALLRLAMANPKFFNEEEHPARRLVESVAQRSFKFNDEFTEEFGGFFQPVQQAFNALNANASSDPQPFADALTALRESWDAQDRNELALQDNGLQSIRYAEERQAMADQIAWELSQRPDVENAPGVILDFLYGPWALVIASAQLDDAGQQLDPGGYRKVVSNLLWSVKKEVTLKRPKELFAMVPAMLATLHSGLDMLGKTREETKPFFDALMRLHQPVLGLRRARIRHDASLSEPGSVEGVPSSLPMDDIPSSMSMDLDETLPATPEQRNPRPKAQPWLGKVELEAAGFQDTMPSDFDDLIESQVQARASADDSQAAALAQEAERADINAAAVLISLREGDWVDLYSHREWLRAQLIWASSKSTLFMFVSRGGRPHSMTKRSCERLIANRLLRPVNAPGAVVEKALQSLKTVGKPKDVVREQGALASVGALLHRPSS
ncbi:DUF1631 family protein [Hydrogenophaga sp. BPS33]|uniref:DUF1631 family protein n=1 Tax=Hydrogenophaga sp. BPS33 TaxID=2651974 RepID=UPI00131F83F4|nr:DUF1631 family protein [Hydrogenophaga sp. BPS33]QHE86647.1 DUF1631 domain-containing protein [Hydrogenophaga sp. BPS33]